jgi:hypothetical protein
VPTSLSQQQQRFGKRSYHREGTEIVALSAVSSSQGNAANVFFVLFVPGLPERRQPMKRLVLAVALLLSMLLTALPAHAAGAQTRHVSFKGQFATAVFDTVDSSGCIETVVTVIAEDRRIKQASPPEATLRAIVELFQFDSCSGKLLLSAFGLAPLTPDQFQIDKQFNAATLNATIEVTDFVSENTFPVDVSVRWTGSGDIVREKDHVHLKEPGFKLNGHFTGTSRNAAASGTVSDGTTNFTPQPAVSAEMGSTKRGEVVIIHG